MTSPKPLQIFRPGRHTAMSGAVLDFSESDLAACASAYDPARHEAPIVVGHPRTDAPAYGWIAGLKSGNGLEATPHQVDPAFAEMVEAGRFKKISASFFTPDSPANPVPGVYYLRHVGFLGAQPPAVKGLRSPEFAEGEAGVVEFADIEDMVNAGLWRRLRDFFIAQFGLEKADAVISDYAVATLEAEARAEDPIEEAPAPLAPAFADPSPAQGDDMSAEEKARLEALEAENKQLKADAAARASQARHAANAAFAESLVAEGRLAPGGRELTVAILDQLDAAPVEFGEGDGRKPIVEAFKAQLADSPKLIEFGERSGVDRGEVVDFADPQAISDAATAYQVEQQKAGRTITHAQAVAHVAAQAKR